jgi:hypothetical protein
MFPTQQPAQLPGLQPPAGWHTPPTHVSPGGHGTHALPFAPHSAGVLPATHVLPTQQPPQLLGPHVTGGWQVRLGGSQMSPKLVQLLHVTPPRPHALLSPPPEQVVPLQQPPQLAGPQLAVPVHVPPPAALALHV